MTPFDLHIMTLTMKAEAETEPLSGIIGVGWVIRTRYEKKTPSWGFTVMSVCLMPKQFSCWNDDYRKRILPATTDFLRQPGYSKIHYLAAGIMADQIDDPTGGADHYFADYIDPPSWADESKFTVQIGRHRFYRLRG